MFPVDLSLFGLLMGNSSARYLHVFETPVTLREKRPMTAKKALVRFFKLSRRM